MLWNRHWLLYCDLKNFFKYFVNELNPDVFRKMKCFIYHQIWKMSQNISKRWMDEQKGNGNRITLFDRLVLFAHHFTQYLIIWNATNTKYTGKYLNMSLDAGNEWAKQIEKKKDYFFRHNFWICEWKWFERFEAGFCLWIICFSLFHVAQFYFQFFSSLGLIFSLFIYLFFPLR